MGLLPWDRLSHPPLLVVVWLVLVLPAAPSLQREHLLVLRSILGLRLIHRLPRVLVVTRRWLEQLLPVSPVPPLVQVLWLPLPVVHSLQERPRPDDVLVATHHVLAQLRPLDQLSPLPLALVLMKRHREPLLAMEEQEPQPLLDLELQDLETQTKKKSRRVRC